MLDLDYEETGVPCECSCCYEFTYEIKGVTNDKLKITFKGKEIKQSDEKYKISPVQFKVVKGDTLNYIDKNGFMQGIWVIDPDTLIRKRYFEYADNWRIKSVNLFPNGQIESESIREKIHFVISAKNYYDYADFNKYVAYFQSGQKKKECYNDTKSNFNSYRDGKCKEWNEKGELVYEGDYRK